MSSKKITATKTTMEEDMVVKEKHVDKCNCKNCGKMADVGWFLLLLGGLAHLLPSQMSPVLTLGWFGVTLQTVVGVLSVMVGIYFLLADDDK